MDKPQTKDNLATSIILQERIEAAQKIMNKHINECLFADWDKPRKKSTVWQKVGRFFKKTKNRISNAYDCLVKGVDPYDY